MESRGRGLKVVIAVSLALMVLIALTGIGQAKPSPGIAWVNTYDIHGNDHGYSMQQTTDGGYILAGEADGLVCLAKVDLAGNMQWNKTYSFGDRAKGYSVKQTTDGGYIVTGTARQDSKDLILLMKTDQNGTQLWNKTYGGAAAGDIEVAGFSAKTMPDGGYLIIAQYPNPMTKNTGLYLIKTDASGNMQSSSMIGKNGDITTPSLEQTSDGGHIIAGTIHFTADPAGYDIYLLKQDATGATQWEKTIGGTGSQYCGRDGSLKQALDGGYVVAGENNGAYLAKLDASGNLQWGKQYANTTGANSVTLTDDGGYALACTGSDGRLVIVKTYATGDEEWRETAGNGSCEAMSVLESADLGYALFGTSAGDLCLVKLKPPAPSPTPTPTPVPSTDNGTATDMGRLSGFGNLFGYPATGIANDSTGGGGFSLLHGSLFKFYNMDNNVAVRNAFSLKTPEIPSVDSGAGIYAGSFKVASPFSKVRWPLK